MLEKHIQYYVKTLDEERVLRARQANELAAAKQALDEVSDENVRLREVAKRNFRKVYGNTLNELENVRADNQALADKDIGHKRLLQAIEPVLKAALKFVKEHQ